MKTKDKNKKFQVEVVTNTRRIYNTDSDSIEAALKLAKDQSDLLELESEDSEIRYRVVPSHTN